MTTVQTGTYPIAENVLQNARADINDMLRSLGGSILTDTAPFTNVFLNRAIRRTQRYLANNGLHSNTIDNFILTPILPVASPDPGIQVSINQNGYFNGVAQLSSPLLPPDIILPLYLMQRQTGSGAAFMPMYPSKGPLLSRMPTSWFGDWEWRDDGLYMVGSTSTMDIRIRYEGALPRIAANANLSATTINIRDGEDALSSALVWVYAASRGAPQRAEAKQAWKEDCDELVNRYVRKDQRICFRPHGYNADRGSIDGA